MVSTFKLKRFACLTRSSVFFQFQNSSERFYCAFRLIFNSEEKQDKIVQKKNLTIYFTKQDQLPLDLLALNVNRNLCCCRRRMWFHSRHEVTRTHTSGHGEHQERTEQTRKGTKRRKKYFSLWNIFFTVVVLGWMRCVIGKYPEFTKPCVCMCECSDFGVHKHVRFFFLLFCFLLQKKVVLQRHFFLERCSSGEWYGWSSRSTQCYVAATMHTTDHSSEDKKYFLFHMQVYEMMCTSWK